MAEKDSMLEGKSRRGPSDVVADSVLERRDPVSRQTAGGPKDSKPETEQAQSPSKPKPEEKWSATLIPTTPAFWREKQADENTYPGTEKSIGSRVALLITNIKFTDEESNRAGAEKDEENMENLLSALGYEVVKHTDLTAKEITEALKTFSRHSKLKETDSVIVVIMSHGKPGTVLGVDQDEFPINNICLILGPKCVALQDKPKIIIIQACRGGATGAVLISDSPSTPEPHFPVSDEELEDDAFKSVHKEKDFIFLHSSTNDTVSYRDPYKGSLLILGIVDVFNTMACKNHVEELFQRVARYVKNYPSKGKKQMPCRDRCTLDRNFFLFPGI